MSDSGVSETIRASFQTDFSHFKSKQEQIRAPINLTKINNVAKWPVFVFIDFSMRF